MLILALACAFRRINTDFVPKILDWFDTSKHTHAADERSTIIIRGDRLRFAENGTVNLEAVAGIAHDCLAVLGAMDVYTLLFQAFYAETLEKQGREGDAHAVLSLMLQNLLTACTEDDRLDKDALVGEECDELRHEKVHPFKHTSTRKQRSGSIGRCQASLCWLWKSALVQNVEASCLDDEGDRDTGAGAAQVSKRSLITQ
jgi:hypothetical protein